MAENAKTATRRLDPGEVSSIDFRKPNENIVWAQAAHASSQYSKSYSADKVCGRPMIFPVGGDHKLSWCASSRDKDPWIEVTFPEVERAGALIVLETCGPGATYEARDVDTNEVLWSGKPRTYDDTRAAKLLHIPLSGPAPRRVRLSVAPYSFKGEFKEIDAVGLLMVSLEESSRDVLADPSLTHIRFAPGSAEIEDLRGDSRIHWAKSANASSEYSVSYRAREATGRPNVYPRGGDHDKTWLPSRYSAGEWLEVTFEGAEEIYGVLVFETCGAGAVTRISGDEGVTLWSAPAEAVPRRKARMLYVRLEPMPMPEVLRIHLAAGDDYREIDAVAVISAPLSELKRKPKPPDVAQPAPSAFEGTLAEETDFVHAVIRTQKNVRAFTWGGPLKLQVGAGEEMELDVDGATLYGPPRFREKGTASELRDKDWLAAVLDGHKLPEDEPIVVEGRRLRGSTRVIARGKPMQGEQRGGFRDADRAPAKLKTDAIAVLDARAKLTAHTPEAFKAGAERLSEGAPHPLRRFALRLFATFLLGATGLVALWALGHPLSGGWAALSTAIAAAGGIFALDFFARIYAIPSYLEGPDRGAFDRSVAFKHKGWVLILALVLMLPMSAGAFLGVGLALDVPEESLFMFGICVAFGVGALLRFFFVRKVKPARFFARWVFY